MCLDIMSCIKTVGKRCFNHTLMSKWTDTDILMNWINTITTYFVHVIKWGDWFIKKKNTYLIVYEIHQ